jgi:hypothetical protein
MAPYFSKTKLFDLLLQCVRGVGRRPQDIDDFDYEAGGDYCCTKNCFNVKVITTEIDGACPKCGVYCICYCSCQSHKAWLKCKHKQCPYCRCERRKSI